MLELIDKNQSDVAPEFDQIDTEGRNVALSAYRGKSNVVLVFNRGFGWPYTRKHMAQLREDYQSFISQQTEIIVFGPEDETTFKVFWQKEKMPFPGIADHQHIIANQYGQEVKILKLGRMPALFVIDRQGLIRFRHRGQSMSDIPIDKDVLSLLKKLNQD